MFDRLDPRYAEWEAGRELREVMYRAWCSTFHQDPEDTRSMIEYERWQLEGLDEAAQQHWPELAS